jgi:hypothetical protein
MRLRKRLVFACLAAGLGAVMASTPASAGGPGVTTVATGLDSPRGIAFYGDKLIVAEAGHGGGDCFNAPGVPFPICIGASSKISWVNTTTGTATPLVSGLVSVSAGPEGSIGVSGLSVANGHILAQIGSTPREAPPSLALAQEETGQLISVHPDGSWSAIAPVGASDFDYTTQFTEPTPGVYSPGTQEHDANPYGVLATQEGAYVADAGANTLDYVNPDGHIQVRVHDLWRDPNAATAFPSDSVPTCVARGKDSLWVGELSGRLLKVNGDHFSVVSNPLLTHVTGCTSDGKGNIYFVNMFGAGAPFAPPPASHFFIGNVVKFNTDTGESSVLVPALPFPNMDVIGPDGNLYVTINSICPTNVPPLSFACNGATGGVVKIAL